MEYYLHNMNNISEFLQLLEQ